MIIVCGPAPKPRLIHLDTDREDGRTMCGRRAQAWHEDGVPNGPGVLSSNGAGDADDPEPTCKVCIAAYAAEGR